MCVIAPDSTPIQAPIANKRKKYQAVVPQVTILITESVLDHDMTYEQAQETFEVSKATVWRIKMKETRARTGEAPVDRPLKKRGRHTEFTPEALVWLCTEIECDSGIHLDALKKGLNEKYQIDVAQSTISKALKSLHITWKSVYPIPTSWNTLK